MTHEARALRELGFDVVVFCAEEFQPPARSFEPLLALHAPLDDADADAKTVKGGDERGERCR